jgi:hypothetical protein
MTTMINLLPATYLRQQIVRLRVAQWTCILLSVLATGWCWHWYESREYRELSQTLETLSREHAPTRTMLNHLMDMRGQLVELQQQETVAKELDCQRNALTLLGIVSDAAHKTNGRLRVTKFELSDFQSARAGAGGPTSAKPAGLILGGESLDNPAVTELIDGLKKSGVFSHVELLALKEREDRHVSLREYEVRCEF